jgi:hypothetical protein
VLVTARLEDAVNVFARLQAAVAENVRDPDGRPVNITFGWAEGDTDCDLQTLTHAADAMLLERKATSRRSRTGSVAERESPLGAAEAYGRADQPRDDQRDGGQTHSARRKPREAFRGEPGADACRASGSC